MKIITLTLNPAFDTHLRCDDFTPYGESLAHITATLAGGKGINISRALKRAGVENTALAVVGEENGAAFVSALADEGLNLDVISVSGRIRENLTLHTLGKNETRISFKGFAAPEGLMDEVKKRVEPYCDDGLYLTFTGRLPQGVTAEEAKTFLKGMKSLGAKIVIDSRSFTLEDILEVGPWLIKPNEEEISALLGRQITCFEDIEASALKLCDVIENVMVTLGEKGAMLASGGELYIAPAPKVEVVSTVGAGDSSIAGFIDAHIKGMDKKACLENAVAFGSAACSQRS